MGIVPVRVIDGQINNNTVTSNTFGIGLSGVNNDIKYNTINGNFGSGINIRFIQPPGSPLLASTGNNITGNTIIGGTRAGDIGVLFYYPLTSGNLLLFNTISGVDTGINVTGGNSIRGNFVTAVSTGMNVTGANSRIYENIVYAGPSSFTVGINSTGPNAMITNNFVNSTGSKIIYSIAISHSLKITS